MENYKVDDLIFELKSAHEQLNKILFESSLSDIHILIQEGKRKRSHTLGSFHTSKSWQDNKNLITLWSAGINGNIEKVLAILVHEMVHQYNFENGLHDTENNGRHNKRFKIKALQVGLIVNKSDINAKHVGYGNTEASESLIDTFSKLDINKKVFRLVHNDSLITNNEGYKKRKTYKCIGCELTITNSRDKDLNILCIDCGFKLEKI